jgi:hypothetical protein
MTERKRTPLRLEPAPNGGWIAVDGGTEPGLRNEVLAAFSNDADLIVWMASRLDVTIAIGTKGEAAPPPVTTYLWGRPIHAWTQEEIDAFCHDEPPPTPAPRPQPDEDGWYEAHGWKPSIKPVDPADPPKVLPWVTVRFQNGESEEIHFQHVDWDWRTVTVPSPASKDTSENVPAGDNVVAFKLFPDEIGKWEVAGC